MGTVVVNGFFVGLVFALLAAGLVVIYRGTRVINFAYGETGMLAAFVFADLWNQHHLPLWVSLMVGLGLAAGIGALTEIFVARPLRHQPPLVTMVGTLAVASLLLVFATRRWGLNPQYLPPLIEGSGVQVAGLMIQPQQMIILGVVVLVLGGVGAMYRYTSFGLRLRATALDRDAASQVGINTDLVATATWALGGAVAGLSAIVIAPMMSFHVFFMTLLAVRGIAAALVGGLTSIWGACAAGVLLGVVTSVLNFQVPTAGITELALAGFIIALLLVRPAGLVRSAY